MFRYCYHANLQSTAGSSSSHITTLLTLYLQTPYKHIRDLTGRLLNQTLSESFMFNHDPEEVQLWLNALPQNFCSSSKNLAMSETQQGVLQFLDNCINRFSKAQYKYTDQLVQLVNTVNSNHGEQGFTRDLILANTSTDIASEYKHPFSPLLLTLCENLNFIKSDKCPAVLYVTNLLTLLLTKQHVPFYLQAICSKLDSELDPSQDAVDPRCIEKWGKNEMIYQAKLCLGQEEGVTLSKKQRSNDKLEDRLAQLIKRKCHSHFISNPVYLTMMMFRRRHSRCGRE